MEIKKTVFVVNKVYGKQAEGYHCLVKVLRQYTNGLQLSTVAHMHFPRVPAKGRKFEAPNDIKLTEREFKGTKGENKGKTIKNTWVNLV